MDDELISQQYQGLKDLQSGEAIIANHSSQFKSELETVLGNDCAVVANSTVTLVFLVSGRCGSLSSSASLCQFKHLVEKM